MKKENVCKVSSRWPGFLLVLVCFLLFNPSGYGQQMTVSGNVISAEDGYGIPGVTIVVKKTGNGTITDANGNYSIDAEMGQVLQFSFIGMKSVEKTIDQGRIDVELESDVVSLDEVVAIGYGSVRKKEVTGAVAQVKSEEIEKLVTSDVASALQGLVAGVNVTAGSGQPGESSDILIRGISSINGNNTPLYVVDGVPQEGNPRISTNEIETIDILKDAASAAIYGTRGAAGVILITTKQGEAGALKVRVNGSYGVQDIRSGTDLMNAEEQTYADFLYHRNLSNVKDNEMNLQFLRSPYSFQYDSDIRDMVFIDYASVQDHSVNISGGKENVFYNVVAGYFNKEGVVVNSGFERFNTRGNFTYRNNNLEIKGSLGLTLENTERSPGGIITQSIKFHPTMELSDPYTDEPINTNSGHESVRLNWVLDSFRNTDEADQNRGFANFNVKYTVLEGLDVNARIGLNAVNDYRHRFNPFQYVYDVDGELVGDPVADSYVIMDSNRSLAVTMNAGATYRRDFGKHSLTLYGGYSVERYIFDSFRAQKYGVTNNKIDVLDGAVANPLASSLNNNYENKLIGMIGRVQYDFADKYLISASVRRDGSSKFAEENRWGTFPSASVAWNVAEEGFWSGMNDIVNNFKIRGSYGTVGNQSFPSYSYSAGITQGWDYTFYDNLEYGAAQSEFANGDVKWETSVQSNLGLDLAFLRNKITFSADYYNTQKEDMLMPIEVPGSNGSIPNVGMHNSKSSNVILNVGDMTNKGYEFALGFKGSSGGLNWSINGTFSTNENEVTKINGLGGINLMQGGQLIDSRTAYSQVTALVEGYEAGAFFLYETDGVIDTHKELADYQKIDSNARMGDLKFVDTNDNGKIEKNDRVYKGSGLPEYEAGLTMGADYKGFDFSLQLYSAIGHEIMNGARATAFAWGRHKDLVYQWSEANPISTVPSYRGEANKHANYTGHTDLWVEDGSYLRLKEITLGYTLPKQLIDKIGFDKFRFYISAQNALTITGYRGYDPEVGGQINRKGLDKGNYPVTALYTAGINVNF